MNRIYKLRWCARLGAMVAVSEITTARGKHGGRASKVAAAVSAALLSASAAQASPPPPPCGSPLSSITTDTTINTALTFTGFYACHPSNNASLTIGSSGVLFATTGSNGAAIQVTSLATAGAIVNNGQIIGTTRAIGIAGTVSGGFLNNGVITGVNSAFDATMGAHITSFANGATGTITGSGGFWAVHFGGTTIDSITNDGYIEGTVGFGLELQTSTVTGDILNTGTIVNGAVVESSLVNGGFFNTGTISRLFDANGADIVGQMSNSGTINGTFFSMYSTVSGGIVNDGVVAGQLATTYSTVSGGILNTGDIHSTGNAVVLSADEVSGGVTNSGTISGATNAIVIGRTSASIGYSNYGVSLSGGISNSGQISAASGDGLAVVGSSITGSVVNSGTIAASVGSGISFKPGRTGLTGAFVRNTVTGSIVNNGTISGDTGVQLGMTDVSGSLTNTAKVTGVQSAVLISGTDIAQGVTNSGELRGTAGDGLLIGGSSGRSSTLSANIMNAGSITGVNGLEIVEASLIDGSVVNTGVIAGSSAAGVVVNFSTVSGTLDNSGTIMGATYGVRVRSSAEVGAIANAVGGTISGDSAALQIGGGSTVTGDISNRGSVVSTGGSAIDMSSATVNGELHNYATGTISGVAPDARDGIRLGNGATVNGGLINEGVINGSVGIAMSTANVAGGITNAAGGVITGIEAGLSIIDSATVSGGITNAGSISGNVGVLISSSVLQGALTNSAGGVIAGDTFGISIDNTTTLVDGITNAGTISGGLRSLDLNNTSDAFAVDNSGTLNGDVALGINTLNLLAHARVLGNVAGTAATVNVLGDFTSEGGFDVDTFNIGSTGVFHIQHAVSVGAGGFHNEGVIDVASNTAAISGDYSQSTAALFRMSLSGESAYGRLQVSGNVVLGGGTGIDVNVLGTPMLGNNVRLTDVIKAGGTLGRGDITVTDNSYLFDFVADSSRDSKAVDLVIMAAASPPPPTPDPTPEPTPDPTPTPSPTPSASGPSVMTAAMENHNRPGFGAARVLDSLIATNGGSGDMQQVISALGSLSTSGQVSNALRQTLPLMTGANAMATSNALHSMNRVIQSRIEDNRGLSSGDAPEGEEHLWIRPFGTHAGQSNRDGVTGFESNTTGLALGLDGIAGDDWRIGGVVTYADSKIDSNAGAPRQVTLVKTYELVGYASQNLDPNTDINYQVDVGYNDNDGSRQIDFGGLDRKARADYGSFAAHVSAGIGRIMPISQTTNLTPSARIDYMNVRTPDYREKDADALDLKVEGSTYEELVLWSDLKLTHQFNPTLKLIGNAAIGYDVLNDAAQTTAAFVGGGSAFTTRGIEPSPLIGRVGVGLLSTSLSNGTEWQLRYEAEARTSDYVNQTVSARWRKRF